MTFRDLSAKMRSAPTLYNAGTSLAYVLAAGYCKRWRMESEGLTVADALLAVVAVPEHFRLEWRALAATLAAAKLAHEEALTGAADSQRRQSKGGGTGMSSVLLKAHVETAMLPRVLWELGKPLQPQLRLFVGSHRAAHAVAASRVNEATPTALAHGIHFIDVLECSLSRDRSKWSLHFLLSGDHGLDLQRASAVLVDVGNDVPVSVPAPLSEFHVSAVPEAALRQLGEALGLASPANSEKGSRFEFSGTTGVSLAITSCKETANTYEVSAEVQGAARGSRLLLTGDIERPTHRCAMLMLVLL